MSNINVIAAWRIAQEPQALVEAITVGETIRDFLSRAAIEVDQAYRNIEADLLAEHMTSQCQEIMDHLASEFRRTAPVLTGLRTMNKAVTS